MNINYSNKDIERLFKKLKSEKYKVLCKKRGFIQALKSVAVTLNAASITDLPNIYMLGYLAEKVKSSIRISKYARLYFTEDAAANEITLQSLAPI